ncbi:MAG: hypothetical protein WCG80_19455 [Spirochaetales bacterium]
MRMVSILSLTFLASLSPPALTASEVPGSAMPSIGPWLLDKKGEPAHWLGHSFQGKKLFEPINVVFIDSFSSTAEEAQAKLFRAVDRAGYGLEIGHSCGYHAFIGQKLFPQIPPKDGTAFSNAEAFLTNNHGRIMGPLQFGKLIGTVIPAQAVVLGRPEPKLPRTSANLPPAVPESVPATSATPN